MKRIAIALSAACAAFLLAGSAYGQAMVGYGHGVANAGAAGAALGGIGVGGALGTVGAVLQQDPEAKGGATVQPVIDPSDLKSRELSGSDGDTPFSFQTATGIRVSGLQPSWRGASRSAAPQTAAEEQAASAAEAMRVIHMAWSNAEGEMTENQAVPSEEGAARVSAAERAPAAAAAPRASAGAAPSTAANLPAAYLSDGAAAGNAQAANPAPEGPALSDAETVGIAIGDNIAAAFEKLGKPLFVMHNIPGRSYTSKYVFAYGERAQVVVLALDGRITSVILQQR